MNVNQYAANIIMTHWTAQHFFKWVPFPRSASFDQNEWADTIGWSTEAWRDFISQALSCKSTYWPWQTALNRALKTSQQMVLAEKNLPHRWLDHNPISCDDPRYPNALRAISDPPAMIFCHGDLSLLSQSMIAIVGSRKASAFALKQSKLLAGIITRQLSVVVSGGALGCDAMAHWGTLECNMRPVRNVVVFAGGVDCLYPRLNAPLFTHLATAGGLFMSERLPGSPCRPLDFPVRNRIISGLSHTIFIMQASLRSGALTTARLALEQGRDVWVLRHPEGDVRADGSAALIRDGAPSFTDARELEDFFSKT